MKRFALIAACAVVLPCAFAADPAFTTSTLLISGVPFVTTSGVSLIPENGAFTLPLDQPVRRLYFLGMTNSIDHGSPGWGAPVGKRDVRFYVGSQIGTISVARQDGSSATAPITLGFNAWWWEAFHQDGYRSPFDTPEGDLLLTSSLRLLDTGNAPPLSYVFALDLDRPGASAISLIDNPSLKGVPVISAITAELADGRRLPLVANTSQPAPNVTATDPRQPMKSVPLSAANLLCDNVIPVLRNKLYSSAEQLAAIKSFPPDPPSNFQGPSITFTGTKTAEMFTNLYSHNLTDMLHKTDGGRYRTSTPGAPNWGRYHGFGTWKDGVGWNENRAWSRDFGPTLIELSELGFQQRAEQLADYAWRWLHWYADVGMKYKDGTPVPPHWTRVIDQPQEKSHNPVREGVQENDGHGLLMLATYKVWQRTADRAAYARKHWRDITGSAEWIPWQFEHPKVSGATDVMRTVSECSRAPQKSPYAEIVCAWGLLSHAEMADAIGETSSAQRWRTYAHKMLDAMPRAYVKQDKEYGPRWDNAFAWGGHYPALGPLIEIADYYGLRAQAAQPDWFPVNQATYLWQFHEHKGQPPDYHAAAFGYGQAFTAEAALLLDRMDEASALVDTMARLAWFPGFKTWIIPEGVEWTEDRKYWFRICDLGNGVQQANMIKTVRLVVGVDDSSPTSTEFVPRLPNGWTGMELKKYPVLTTSGTRMIDLQYSRPSTWQHDFNLTSDAPMPSIGVRLGPFAPDTKLTDLQVHCSDYDTTHSLQHEGQHNWLWLRTMEPPKSTRMEIHVNQAMSRGK